MVSLDCNMAGVSFASSSHIVIRGTAAKIKQPVHKLLLLGGPTLKRCSQMDFKETHNNGEDPLTNRKDAWAESKDLNGLFIDKSISKDLKEPKRALGTLTKHHCWLGPGHTKHLVLGPCHLRAFH